MKKAIEISLILIVFILVNIQSAFYQKQITFNSGQGWDGVEYFTTAKEFSQNIKPNAKAPFVYRIGTPLLVSKIFPNDINYGFKTLNLYANFILIVLFYLILSHFTQSSFLRILFSILYVIQFHAPIRFTYFYPIHTDSIALIFLFCGILVLIKDIKNKFIYLSLIGIIGIYFREIAIIPSFIYMLINFKENKYKRISTKYFIPFLITFVAMFSIKFIVSQSNTYQSYNAVFDYLYNKSILMYVHSLLISFGPIILLLIYLKVKGILNFNIPSRTQVYFLISIILILAFVGGSDTERLAYWSAPLVFGFLAFQIDKNNLLRESKILLSVLLVFQIYSSRILFIIPDYPSNANHQYGFLTQFGNNFQYLDLFAFHSDNKVRLIGFASYLFLAVFVYAYAKFENKVSKRKQS
ncbi:MAG: hypothetical protein NTW25_14235 [Candidatus Kapabacteria bacterium]|nr:hypothetical protein [Candidatus Kapabacteria bacterium]